MPLTLKQFTEEFLKNLVEKYDCGDGKGTPYEFFNLREVQNEIATAITEAWEEAQKWDEAAVKNKSFAIQDDEAGVYEDLHAHNAAMEVHAALLSAQEESRK